MLVPNDVHSGECVAEMESRCPLVFEDEFPDRFGEVIEVGAGTVSGYLANQDVAERAQAQVEESRWRRGGSRNTATTSRDEVGRHVGDGEKRGPECGSGAERKGIRTLEDRQYEL